MISGAALADNFEPGAAFCGPICGLRQMVLDELDVNRPGFVGGSNS
jgi:hypothetical protein